MQTKNSKGKKKKKKIVARQENRPHKKTEKGQTAASNLDKMPFISISLCLELEY